MNAFRHAAVATALALTSPVAASAQERPGLAPVYAASEGWLNGAATPNALRGRVVVVDVFTFGCFNCKNVVPALKAIDALHSKDVAVIGIHSPETAYEKDRANVARNLKAQGITWPVAIDNSFAIWKAYRVDAWPTQLFFDRHGNLRKTIVGDSQDENVRATISELVAEK